MASTPKSGGGTRKLRVPLNSNVRFDMSIEDPDVIDIISTDKNSGIVVLSTTDHLEWSDNEHLYKIQEKINSYLAFIESGEIYESYPKAKGKRIEIEVIFKYPPDEQGICFLNKCSEAVHSAGFRFEYKVS